jgi:hypothetical protein
MVKKVSIKRSKDVNDDEDENLEDSEDSEETDECYKSKNIIFKKRTKANVFRYRRYICLRMIKIIFTGKNLSFNNMGKFYDTSFGCYIARRQTDRIAKINTSLF